MLNAPPAPNAPEGGDAPGRPDSPAGRPGARSGIGRYILLRLCFVPAGALAVATLTFFLVNLVPSDPVGALLGNLATPAQIRATKARLGLNQDLGHRYLAFLNGLVHGTLGHSYYSGASVGGQIVSKLASSGELIVLGFAVAWTLGVTLGALGAYRAGSMLDRVLSGVVALTQAVPDYVIGLIGALLLFYVLHILPAPTGQLGLTTTPPSHITGAAFLDAVLTGNGPAIGDAFAHLVMPVLALGIANSVVFARVTRSTMSTALNTAYVEFARAQGLSDWTVVRQAFRASKVPIITYSATVAAGLVGGDAIIEQVFNWQGIGQWAVTGLLNEDLPVVQGFVLLSGTVTLLAYLVADLLILRADPRIRRPFGGES
jgi:ABC-type dipeptide/oligopeptide/nickel transport system permease component